MAPRQASEVVASRRRDCSRSQARAAPTARQVISARESRPISATFGAARLRSSRQPRIARTRSSDSASRAGQDRSGCSPPPRRDRSAARRRRCASEKFSLAASSLASSSDASLRQRVDRGAARLVGRAWETNRRGWRRTDSRPCFARTRRARGARGRYRPRASGKPGSRPFASSFCLKRLGEGEHDLFLGDAGRRCRAGIDAAMAWVEDDHGLGRVGWLRLRLRLRNRADDRRARLAELGEEGRAVGGTRSTTRRAGWSAARRARRPCRRETGRSHR